MHFVINRCLAAGIRQISAGQIPASEIIGCKVRFFRTTFTTAVLIRLVVVQKIPELSYNEAWFRVATLVVTLFLIEGAQSLERLGGVFSGYMAFETKGFDRLEKKIEKQETGHKPSIALQYVQQAHHAYDLGVMCNISKALGEKTSDLPDAADVVVHLRLGDVLKDDPVRDPWNSKAKLAYVINQV